MILGIRDIHRRCSNFGPFSKLKRRQKISVEAKIVRMEEKKHARDLFLGFATLKDVLFREFSVYWVKYLCAHARKSLK